jgi:hypothetical protein
VGHILLEEMPRTEDFMRFSLLLSLFLACFGWQSVARSEEHYYVILFGSQSTPRLPRYTHTWGTFVKASGEGEDSSKYHIDEVFTISWLPADLVVRSLRVRAEEGVNLDLEATLAYVLPRERVSEWGPFQISQIFYDRAVERQAELESGAVKYEAIDPNFGPRVSYVSDCIHGITDLDPDYGRSYYREVRRFGEAATHWVAYQFVYRGRRINLEENLDWINERLGLDNYPIVHRPPPERRIWLFDR